jgi:hypothetical protein
VRNGLVSLVRRDVASKFKGLEIDICPSTGEEANHVGFDQVRDEKLFVAPTGAGRQNRVHRMDAGWSPETFEVCRVERR